MSKQITLPMLASMVSSDRINKKNNYRLINKYTGPLPMVVEIKGGKQ